MNAIIIVYDVTEQTSFDHGKHWLADSDKHASSNVHKLLIGNKADLADKKVVDYVTAKQYADSVNMPFIETKLPNSLYVRINKVIQYKDNYQSA